MLVLSGVCFSVLMLIGILGYVENFKYDNIVEMVIKRK